MLKLSVIICTYNRAMLLKKCLKSLIDQVNKNFEIIVVDNNSVDNTKEVVSDISSNSIHYIFEASVGLSYARNTGYKNSLGEYIAYIDDDAYADPFWCDRIIKNTIQYEFDVCGGVILPYYEEKPPIWFDDRLEIRNYGKKGFVSKVKARQGFSGSNIIFKKEHLYHFGGFDTELGMKGNKMGIGEESLLCKKISEIHNKFFFDPEIVVFHFTPKRNVSIKYRIHRNFLTGCSYVKIKGYNPYQITKKFITLIALIMLLPISLLSFRIKNYYFVYILQQISYRVGYIVTALFKNKY
jgi:glycosyltransferase involved in cell wall biosynthesis